MKSSKLRVILIYKNNNSNRMGTKYKKAAMILLRLKT